ncbi:MAG: FAD:protein FMN transferase [Pseudomonadota bacterium]
MDPATLSRRSFMVLPAPLALAACASGPESIEVSGLTMGTSYRVVAIDHDGRLDPQEVAAAVDGALAEVNAQMSNWDPTSEISRFNAQAGDSPVAVSAALSEVMQAAESVHLASGGRFDTTMGPLIELWGFGAPGAGAMPSEAEIEAARARSGHANALEVGQGALRKRRPEAQVYLAAIGKGYGADRVGRALKALGATDYMVEIGGDLYVAGRNADGLRWRIGIEAPALGARDLLQAVNASDMGLASSGGYRNYFERDGKRFSHMIDPVRGRPVEHDTAAVTVLAESAMLADAWATALHVIGKEEGLPLAERLGLAALFTEVEAGAAGLGYASAATPRFDALTA